MATIQEIGRALNLSHTTVSRVLNGRNDQFISHTTRQRVKSAALEMGYRPNRAARSLVTGRTRQVALWVRRLTTAYDAQVIMSLVHEIEQSDYQVLIRSSDRLKMNGAEGPNDDEHTMLDALWSVDGCILYEAMRSQFRPLFERDHQSRLAVVGMGGASYSAANMPEMDYVGVDLRVGVDEALRHLLEIGCRRIGFVGPYTTAWREPRSCGYEAAMHDAGLPEEIISTGVTRAQARTAVRDHIAANGAPDGLLCFNDDVAIGAYRGVRDLGLSIPQDVAIVGHDGIEDTEYLDTPITTLLQPVDEMCKLAWNYLRRRIEEPSTPPQQTLLRSKFCLRASTGR